MTTGRLSQVWQAANATGRKSGHDPTRDSDIGRPSRRACSAVVGRLPRCRPLWAIESAYMPLVLDKCDDVTLPEMEERGAVFRFQGYGGIAVRVA